MRNKIYTAFVAALFYVLPGITANAQWVNTGAGPFNTPEIIKVGDSVRLYGLINNFSSADNGDTWIKDSIHGMGVYPNLVSIEKCGNKYFGGDPYGYLYESTDGLFWTQNYYLGYAASMPYIFTEGNNIYVAVDGVGVLHSNDAGANWMMGDTGLTAAGNNISQIVKVGNDLFISTLDGVFKSSDDGAHWVQKNTGLAPSMQCNGIAYSQGALLTSGYGFGVYRSTDMGENWTQVTNGFGGYLFVGGFYTNGNFMVVGGSNCKAHYSTDGGLNWTLIAQGAGYGFSVFNDFLIDNGYLFAATSAYCIKVSLADLGVSTGLSQTESVKPSIALYPNPANSNLSFVMDGMQAAKQLSVFDVNGSLVFQQSNPCGKIDVAPLTSGFYILSITTNDKTVQQKFMVQH